MDKKNWEDGMSNIDDELLNEAISYNKKKRWLVPAIGGVAAAAVIAGVSLSVWNGNTVEDDSAKDISVALDSTAEGASEISPANTSENASELADKNGEQLEIGAGDSKDFEKSDDMQIGTEIGADEAVESGIHYFAKAPAYEYIKLGYRNALKLKDHEFDAMESFVNKTGAAFYDGESNYAYSPLSLFTALGMLMECENSDGAADISEFLGVNADEVATYVKTYMDSCLADDAISVFLNANSAWVKTDRFNDEGLSKLAGLSNSYQADVIQTDDLQSLSEEMGAWIKQKTKGLIDTVPEVDEDTALVLIDTLYMKSKWVESIYWNDMVRSMEFTDAKGNTSLVKALLTNDDFLYDKNDRYETVRIKYSDGGYLVVLLPAEGINPSELLGGDVEKVIRDINDRKLLTKYVLLSLPEFEIDSELNGMQTVLASLGLDTSLSSNAFTGLTNTELKVDNINQNSKIIVNRVGTEAATKTEIDITCAEMEHSDSVSMIVDRPFAFAICSPAGVAEYVGIVNYGINAE